MDPADLTVAILVVLAGILASAAYGAVSVSPADFRKARICFVLSAMCIAGVAVVWGLSTTQPLWVRIIAAGLIGAIASVGLTEALRWLSRREQVVSIERAPDVSLVFECHLAELPTKVPAEGHIYTLPLFYSPDSGVLRPISLSTIHGQPGSNFVWFSDLKFPQVYRCEITNYGSAPLLQVTLTFKVEYRDDLHNLAHSYEWPVLLSKIDRGNSNAATFYVYNQSRYHAHVNPPDIANYFILGENTPRQGSLLPIGMVAGMSLWPVEEMK